MSKARLTVTVDPAVVQAGNDAVADGRVDSLSAWVNLALTERADKDRRLRAMAEAVAAYEAEFGTITDEEMAARVQADRAAAIIVRGRKRGTKRRRRRVAA